MSAKRYDRRYFDRWYRDPRTRMWTRAAIARKVRLALGVAEQVLGRPVRNVLDVGCGEGSWRAMLRRQRPGLRYSGVDGSDYVVRRFGRRRNIVHGAFGRLDALGLRGPFDLIVCCDVMHYVANGDLAAGLAALRALAAGPAYLEAYTAEDDVEGDDSNFFRRRASWYRRQFRHAGFVPVGMQCWVTADVAADLTALERSGW